MQKEIEIRYEIKPAERDRIMKSLVRLGWRSVFSLQHDTYYCERKYVEQRIAQKCPYVIRLRKTDKASFLAYKSFGNSDEKSWIELETEVGDRSVTQEILLRLKQVPFMEIQKDRLSGRVEDIEVNLDYIPLLGHFLELEIISEDEAVSRQRLTEFGIRVGLSEKRVITSGYVQLLEKRIADGLTDSTH